MGAANPIDETAQAKITEIQSRIINSFGVHFGKEYAYSLIAGAKASSRFSTAIALDKRKLHAAKDADYTIKEGMMKKDPPTSFASWHDRWFVAKNAADNYQVEYWDRNPELPTGEKDASAKSKGVIELKPYRCEKFTIDERAAHPFGVKLVPRRKWDKKCRIRHMACKDAEEEKAWLDVLSASCYKSKRPRGGPDDGPIFDAFSNALARVASEERCYDSFDDYGNEESFCRFLYHVLEREVLQKCWDSCPEGPGKSTLVAAAEKGIYTAMSTAVSVALSGVIAAARATRETIQGTIAKGLEPLVQKEVALTQSVTEIFEKSLGASLKALTTKLFPNTMATLAVPIGLAFQHTIRGFHTACKETMIRGITSAATDAKKLNTAQINADRGSALYPAYKVAWEIPKILGTDSTFQNETSFCAVDVVYMVRDACTDLYRAAVQQFFREYREQFKAGPVDLNALCARITGEMIHDAPSYIDSVYWEIFGQCMMGNILWVSMIRNPTLDATKPIGDTIDKLPAPLPTLVDFNGIIDRVLEAAARACLAPSIKAATGGLVNRDMLVAELAASPEAAAD